MMSKRSYYIADTDDVYYFIRPLIYDDNYMMEAEISEAMTWVSFLDLLPTLFWEGGHFLFSSRYWETNPF